MVRTLFPALLLLAFALVGCDDSTTNPDNSGQPPIEYIDGNPITADTAAVVADAWAGSVIVPLQSHTRDAFQADDRLALTWTGDLVEDVRWPEDEIEPYATIAMEIVLKRPAPAEPGLLGDYLTLWYQDQYMQLITLLVQEGTPDAVPIGTVHNYLRIPADQEWIDVGVINHTGEDWGLPVPGKVETKVFAILGYETPMVTVPDGQSGAFGIQLDRAGLDPGTYLDELTVFWGPNPAQIIMLEVEVGE